MKSTSLAIACVLAVAAGGALAADQSGDHSVVDSTKSTVRHAGDKLGHMLHLDKKGQQQSASNDASHENTRAMGASHENMHGSMHSNMHDTDASHARKPGAAADPSDTPSREERMDTAYDNWKSQHGNDKR